MKKKVIVVLMLAFILIFQSVFSYAENIGDKNNAENYKTQETESSEEYAGEGIETDPLKLGKEGYDTSKIVPFAVEKTYLMKWNTEHDRFPVIHDFWYTDGTIDKDPFRMNLGKVKVKGYGKGFGTEGGWSWGPINGVHNNPAEWNDDSKGWNECPYYITTYSSNTSNSIVNKIYRISCEHYGKSFLDEDLKATSFAQMAIYNKLPLANDHSENMANGVYLTRFRNASVDSEYKTFLKNVIEPELKLWSTKPSFSGSTVSIEAGKTKTLTDTTGSLKYYDAFTYTKNGVTISHKKNGTTLSVTASFSAKEKVTMTESDLINNNACKYPYKSIYSNQYVEFTHPRRQDIVIPSGRVTPQAMTLNFNVHIPKASLKIRKSSTEPSLTNLCPQQYSLTGAEYGVYQYKSDAESNVNRLATLRTNASGLSQTVTLNPTVNSGIFYIKEITPSKGFLLDKVVHKVTLKDGDTVEFPVKEKPYFDPMTITLQKQIPNGKTEFQKYLEGAEYTVRYYPDILNTESEVKAKKPLRTWVFRTNANGEVRIRESWKVGGDELFKNDKGTVVGLIGTYTVEETKAPSGFVKNSGIEIRHVKKGVEPPDINGTNAPVMSELPDNNINRKITVTKKIAEKDYYEPFGTPTAIFELTGKDVFGKTYKFRKSITLSKSTLKDGYYTGSVVFSNLPAGEYTVREIGALRYKFKSISNTSSNGVVSGQKVNFELVNTLTGSTTYQNEIKRWDKISHNICRFTKL